MLICNKLWCETTANPRLRVAMQKTSLHSQSLDGSKRLPEEPIAGNVDKMLTKKLASRHRAVFRN